MALLPRIVDFALQGENQLSRVAVVMDVRGVRNSDQLEQALADLDAKEDRVRDSLPGCQFAAPSSAGTKKRAGSIPLRSPIMSLIEEAIERERRTACSLCAAAPSM